MFINACKRLKYFSYEVLAESLASPRPLLIEKHVLPSSSRGYYAFVINFKGKQLRENVGEGVN